MYVFQASCQSFNRCSDNVHPRLRRLVQSNPQWVGGWMDGCMCGESVIHSEERRRSTDALVCAADYDGN